MKKITLSDIMESLGNDDIQTATDDIHEWFIGQGRHIQSRITGEVGEEEVTEDSYDEQVDLVQSKKFSEMTDEEKDIFFDNLPDADSDWDDLQAEIGYPVKKGKPGIITFTILGKKLTIAAIDENIPNHGMVLRKLMAQTPGSQEITKIPGYVAGDHDDTFMPMGVVLKVEDVMAESENHNSEDFYNLEEGFSGLETVSDKLQNVEGAQVGEEGKVPVNTKSTLPSHKGEKRIGGEPVEIKSDDHNSHALEKYPKVVSTKTKGNVQNSKDDPKKVVSPKGSLLNKMDGSVNTRSPISGEKNKK